MSNQLLKLFFIVMILSGCSAGDFHSTNPITNKNDSSQRIIINGDFSKVESESLKEGVFLWEEAMGTKLAFPVEFRDEVIDGLIGKYSKCLECDTLDIINIDTKEMRDKNFGVIAWVSLSMHEVGHALGLSHSDDGLMQPDLGDTIGECVDNKVLKEVCSNHECVNPKEACPE